MLVNARAPSIADSNVRLKAADFILFAGAGVIAVGINILGHSFFPSQNWFPYITRTTASALSVSFMIWITIILLRRSGLAPSTMGLRPSSRSMKGLLFGIGTGVVAILLLGLLLYMLVPFHFSKGPLTGADVMKEGYAYFWGNFLEELLFRGYPFITLSAVLGWRKAAFVMALPFGLFHLPGTGFNMEGLKMVLTTATFSFVFSYSFVLTRSLWAAIGVHVITNTLLHAVTGLDGMKKAMFIPVFEKSWPAGYDAGLVVFEITAITIAVLLYSLQKSFKSARKSSVHLY